MAEGLAREILGDFVQVGSAGMEACVGESASTAALKVLEEQKVDISGHLSRRINPEMMADADFIIPMTQAQEEALRHLFPHYLNKIRCLGDWGKGRKDVLDPWGGSLEVYRQTAYEIGNLLRVLKGQLKDGTRA